jgi:hypothetical protein
LHIGHGLYFAAASFSGIGIALRRKELRPALRWGKASFSQLRIW